VSMESTPSDRPPRQDDTPNVQVVLRPLATPLSLGFLGLAAAALADSGLLLHWFDPVHNWTMVGLALLVFPVPLQTIGAVIGFLDRDAVAATGLGLLAASWLALGASMFIGSPGQLSPGMGLLLIGAAVALMVPTISAWTSKAVASAVMGLAGLRFGLTGAYEMTGAVDWRLADAAAGLLLFGLAVYAALAFELESTNRATVLPTGRRGRGSVAIGGSFREEVAGLHHEPGVRQQL